MSSSEKSEIITKKFQQLQKEMNKENEANFEASPSEQESNMETGADDKAKTQSGDDEADWETQSESEDDESKPQKWKAIEIGDETDVYTLIDTLAMEPALCHFKLEFEKSTKSVQDRAEQYWSVLLAVAYCNSNDKEITIVHNEQQDGLSPKWNFIKN